jgi:TPR repeat protein
MGSQAYAQRRFSIAAGYMERAAAMGHTRAQAALGGDFVRGTGEPKDLAKAIYWLTLAADKGHRVAQAELGDLYEEGDGVPQDLTKAFHYHQLGAAQGWWQAELRLGLEYELGYGTPRSRAEALRWLDRATNDGQDGFSQGLAIMLRRSDTPTRFRDMDELFRHYGTLVGPPPTPPIPPGKNCREHYIPGGTGQSTFWCS